MKVAKTFWSIGVLVVGILVSRKLFKELKKRPKKLLERQKLSGSNICYNEYEFGR